VVRSGYIPWKQTQKIDSLPPTQLLRPITGRNPVKVKTEATRSSETFLATYDPRWCQSPAVHQPDPPWHPETVYCNIYVQNHLNFTYCHCTWAKLISILRTVDHLFTEVDCNIVDGCLYDSQCIVHLQRGWLGITSHEADDLHWGLSAVLFTQLLLYLAKEARTVCPAWRWRGNRGG